MNYSKKKLPNVLFLYPCYQYYFYERLFSNRRLSRFFDQITKIPDMNIFIKFHPRHFNVHDRIFDYIAENNINYSVDNDLANHIDNFDTVVGFEPSGALIDSISYSKKVVYINDYMNIYDNEISLKTFLKTINSMSFDEFLLRCESQSLSELNVLSSKDVAYFVEYEPSSIDCVFTEILG